MSWRYYNPGYSQLLTSADASDDAQNGISVSNNQDNTFLDFPASKKLYLLARIRINGELNNKPTSRTVISITNSESKEGIYIETSQSKLKVSNESSTPSLTKDISALAPGKLSTIYIVIDENDIKGFLDNKNWFTLKTADYLAENVVNRILFSRPSAYNGPGSEFYLKNLILSDEYIMPGAYLKEVTPTVSSDGWVTNSDGTYSTMDTGKTLTCALPANSSDLADLKILGWTPIAKDAVGGGNVAKINISGTSYSLTSDKAIIGGFVGTDKTIITEGAE